MVKKFFCKLFEKPEKKKASACVIQSRMIEVRKRILYYVRGEEYSISAKCPECGHSFDEVNILDQFLKQRGEFNLHLRCPHCGCGIIRPKIKINNREVYFLSPLATSMSLLDEDLCLHPSEIRKSKPVVYYSAIFNFGSLKNAFLQIRKRKYKYVEVRDWNKRVKLIPKTIPDRVISQVLGVSEREVSRHR